MYQITGDQFALLAAALTATTFILFLGALFLVYRQLRNSFRLRKDEVAEITTRLQTEVDERKKSDRDLADTREELERQKQFFEQVFLQSSVATQIFDPEGNRLRANTEWCRLFDTIPKEAESPYNIFEDRSIQQAGLAGSLRRVIADGITAEWEVLLEGPGRTGGMRWFRIKAFPVWSSTWTVTNMIVHYDDVSDRRRSEEQMRRSLKEKELLLREVHHRVKNNMQLMKSMLKLQAAYVSDPTTLAMFTDSASRINTMALIHEKLYQNENFGRVAMRDYFTYIADSLYQTYSRDGVSIHIKRELDDIVLDIDTAIPCGLLANELISNALKHAFGGRRRGLILLTFRKLNATVDPTPSTPPSYILGVSDDGSGFSHDPRDEGASSLGLKLVSSLVQQLGGELSVSDRRRSGTVVEVKFPVSRGADLPAAGVR